MYMLKTKVFTTFAGEKAEILRKSDATTMQQLLMLTN